MNDELFPFLDTNISTGVDSHMEKQNTHQSSPTLKLFTTLFCPIVFCGVTLVRTTISSS